MIKSSYGHKMPMREYMPRLVDNEIKMLMGAFGAVEIAGPKWCGKSTTAERICKSTLRMQDPVTRGRNLELASLRPSQLLKGENPRLIGEWQAAPQLWDAVRIDVDRRGETGLYVMTRSSSADRTEMMHSGIGRIGSVRMRTLSLSEMTLSTGTVTLKGLFNGEESEGRSPIGLEDVARLIVRGGWPASVGKSDSSAATQVSGYCERIVVSDIDDMGAKRRDPKKMRALLRSLSRNTSAPLSPKAILEDMESDGMRISENTLHSYLGFLKGIHVLDELPSWIPPLRTKTAIRTKDTIHLCDPSIAACFLSASKEDLMSDPDTFVRLFKSLAVRDLRIYAQSMGGSVHHYRDGSGLEADSIIRLRNGKWGAVEMKLGHNGVEAGARSLLKLKRKVDTDRMKEPSFLAVVTADGTAYIRGDGVHVVPIGCLAAGQHLAGGQVL